MTRPTYDRAFWEQLWTGTLRDHATEVGGKVGGRAPSAHLVAEVGALAPGRALDAGAGHGADALWLAANGWQVTAVDFAAAALAHGRAAAERLGPDVAGRVAWVEADLVGGLAGGLATWPVAEQYDLVICQYVHVAGSVTAMVRRLASGVAPGGTLLLVGHAPIDPATGAATAAADQVQVSVEAAMGALDARAWEVVVAEERPRAVAGSGVDAVIRARRLSPREQATRIAVRPAGVLVDYATFEAAVGAAAAPSPARLAARAAGGQFAGRRLVAGQRTARECLLEFSGPIWLRVWTEAVPDHESVPCPELVHWQVAEVAGGENPALARAASDPAERFAFEEDGAAVPDFGALIAARRHRDVSGFRVSEMGFHVAFRGATCLSFGPLARADNGQLVLFVGEDD